MTQSQIVRVPPGLINEVNDTVIGGTPVGTSGGTGAGPFPGTSKTAGQLGKWCDLDAAMLFYNPDISTLFGGEYQYVRLDPDAADSPGFAPGTLLYFKTGVDPDLFVVTESANANDEAGYSITAAGAWTPGNYAWIYRFGQRADRTPVAP